MLTLIITLVVVGIILWAINTYIPMDSKIKTLLNVVVIIVLVLWLLSIFGILGAIDNVNVPRVR